MFRWLRSRRSAGFRPQRPTSSRPALESLEDRCLLSGNVLQTNLVSDLPGVAQVLDPHLVNPWGISESAGSAFWISDNNAGLATLYNTQGVKQGLEVSIPTPGDPLGASGAPTGTVFNIDGGKAGGFVIGSPSTTTGSASAIFLFATEDGTIVGWNPGVNPLGSDPMKAGTFGIIAVDNSGNNFTEPDPALQTGAVYKGLTIATGTSGPIFAGDPNSTTVLYAANFRAGQIDVFDTNFKPVTLPKGAFTDSDLPAGYAPFNVQELGGKIYVTYALQNDTKHDDVAGAHHGFVDVFNLDGTPGLSDGTERLVSGGKLDSPWGLALAPKSFGKLAGDLLVGNFGNGRINVYNPVSGSFLDTLKDPDGEPIQIDGLWALKVGNGGAGGDAQTVYFTAGLDHEMHGLFGSLKPVAPGTPEGSAEVQKVIAALDVFQLDFNTLQQDIANKADPATIAQDRQTVAQDRKDLIKAEAAFLADAGADLGHHGSSPHHSDTRALENRLDRLFEDLFG
jgi:uncharacterized protein (TIGR03118 family)